MAKNQTQEPAPATTTLNLAGAQFHVEALNKRIADDRAIVGRFVSTDASRERMSGSASKNGVLWEGRVVVIPADDKKARAAFRRLKAALAFASEMVKKD